MAEIRSLGAGWTESEAACPTAADSTIRQTQKAASQPPFFITVFFRTPVIEPQESSPLVGSRSPNAAGQLWLPLRPARYSLDPGCPPMRFSGSPESDNFPELPPLT